jgi:hypothetical protein
VQTLRWGSSRGVQQLVCAANISCACGVGATDWVGMGGCWRGVWRAGRAAGPLFFGGVISLAARTHTSARVCATSVAKHVGASGVV